MDQKVRIDQALDWGSKQGVNIQDEDAASSRLDSELLLAHVLDKNRTWLKVWPEFELSSEQLLTFKRLIKRRQLGEPIAYIIGSKDFWTLTLKVTPDTLIPRPETELLVELVLDKTTDHQAAKIADLGTGTGAIALSIATQRALSTVYAVDYSEKALQVAEHNRQAYQLNNVVTHFSNWLLDWPFDKLDIIVSNPPYVEPGDPHLEQLTFEPDMALVALDKGLADIKKISLQATHYLKSGGWLLFEHGYNQADAVQDILQKQGFSGVSTYQDLAGVDRVTVGQWL